MVVVAAAAATATVAAVAAAGAAVEDSPRFENLRSASRDDSDVPFPPAQALPPAPASDSRPLKQKPGFKLGVVLSGATGQAGCRFDESDS